MYFWCFGYRGELGFLNCDDVCMCVVNKQFELLEFLFLSPFMLTCSMMRFLSLLLLGLCGVSSPVVVCLLGCRSSLCCECGCCGDCDACTVVCVACVCAVRVRG